MPGRHQTRPNRLLRVPVGPFVTVPAQPLEVVQPVRIRPAPARDVVHLGHRTGLAMLTDARVPLPHLLSPFRVDGVALPSPVGHRLHGSSSSRTAASNSSADAAANARASLTEMPTPPAFSSCRIGPIRSGGAGKCASSPHDSHVHTSRHGRRSSRVRASGTGVRALHPRQGASWRVFSGSRADTGELGLSPVGVEERLDRRELRASGPYRFSSRLSFASSQITVKASLSSLNVRMGVPFGHRPLRLKVGDSPRLPIGVISLGVPDGRLTQRRDALVQKGRQPVRLDDQFGQVHRSPICSYRRSLRT